MHNVIDIKLVDWPYSASHTLICRQTFDWYQLILSCPLRELQSHSISSTDQELMYFLKWCVIFCDILCLYILMNIEVPLISQLTSLSPTGKIRMLVLVVQSSQLDTHILKKAAYYVRTYYFKYVNTEFDNIFLKLTILWWGWVKCELLLEYCAYSCHIIIKSWHHHVKSLLSQGSEVLTSFPLNGQQTGDIFYTEASAAQQHRFKPVYHPLQSARRCLMTHRGELLPVLICEARNSQLWRRVLRCSQLYLMAGTPEAY